MEFKDLTDQLRDIKLRLFLPAVTVAMAWSLIGFTLTRNIDLNLANTYAGLSLILLIVLGYFWKDLNSSAGTTWRNIISSGIFINAAAVFLVLTDAFSNFLIEFSVLYWIAVPGYGLMVNANLMEENSNTYVLLAHISSFATVVYTVAFLQHIDFLILLSALGIGITQSIAAYKALETRF